MDNELMHYGILGMKWGIRRYQNSDGTWTEAGKKRYNDGESVNETKTAKQESGSGKTGASTKNNYKQKAINFIQSYRAMSIWALYRRNSLLEAARYQVLRERMHNTLRGVNDREAAAKAQQNSADLRRIRTQQRRNSINRRILQRAYTRTNTD